MRKEEPTRPDPTHPDARADAPIVAPPVLGATRVGRYELLIKLAAGGMATVYLGRQRGAGGFERVVAIKRLHPHVNAVPELAAAFLDEARIASLIEHPNVVRVHDVHEDAGERLLVMDYVDGASLAAMMKGARAKKEPIPTGVTVRIVSEALAGLHAAHELRTMDGRALAVVHRDATPQNVLIGHDGTVRLTDFGIARAAERSVETATGHVKGKFRYMPPEQASAREVDRRVDVFAMGIVLWEMLAGRRFLAGETDAEVLRAIAMAEFPKLVDAVPTIDLELAAIVDKAVEAEAKNRWPTALDFASALEAWGRTHGAVATQADVARALDRFCGEDIRKQRATFLEVLSGRQPPAGPGTPGPAPITASGRTQQPISASGSVSRHVEWQSIPAPPPGPAPGTRALGMVAIGATLVAVIGTLVLLVAGREKRPEQAPSAPVAAAPAPATSARPAAEVPRITVSISSPRALSSLRAPGLADLALRDGGATFTLPRGEDPVVLRVRFDDGSELDEIVKPTESVALLLRAGGDKSRPKTPTAGKATPATPPPATPPAETPPLRKNPYE